MDKKAAEAMASLIDDFSVDDHQLPVDDMEPANSMGDEIPEDNDKEKSPKDDDSSADDQVDDDEGEGTEDDEPEDDADEQTVSKDKPDVQLSELEELQQRNAALLERLQKLETPVQQQVPYQQAQTTQRQQPVQQPAPVQPFNLKFEPKDFLTSDELDRLMDRPELINTGLNRMLNYLAEVLQPQVGQTFNQIAEVVQQLPAAAAESTRSQYEAMSLADEFYRNNPDLKPYRRVVSAIAEESLTDLQTKLQRVPTWAEVFDTTSERVRKELGLNKPTKEKPKKRKAALPGAKTSAGRATKRDPKTNTEPTERDLMLEMMEGD